MKKIHPYIIAIVVPFSIKFTCSFWHIHEENQQSCLRLGQKLSYANKRCHKLMFLSHVANWKQRVWQVTLRLAANKKLNVINTYPRIIIMMKKTAKTMKMKNRLMRKWLASKTETFRNVSVSLFFLKTKNDLKENACHICRCIQ